MDTLQYIRSMLARRNREHSLRTARTKNTKLIDFCSNDYLGFAQSQQLRDEWMNSLKYNTFIGATGSRLLTGHHAITTQVEQTLAHFHKGEQALLFNSGYDANISLLMTLVRRKDLIIYDELVHASIHDAMKICPAPNLMFRHNDTKHLEELLVQHNDNYANIFVLTESVYSMDGDQSPVHKLAYLQDKFQFKWIMDEAHSTGTFGEKGEGLIVQEGLTNHVFARLHTFGKAIGIQGAAVIGSTELCTFLFNFARPLIYTTALPIASQWFIQIAYEELIKNGVQYLRQLNDNIQYFIQLWQKLNIPYARINSHSSIQSIIIGGNENTRQLAHNIQEKGFDVRPILAPTVPRGQERIRVCIHRFNTKKEIEGLISAFIN